MPDKEPFCKDIVFDDVNAERLSLLAAKYVGNYWSAEMEARLNIKHEEIVSLLPRIDQEQIKILEEMRETLKRNDVELSKLLNELGIK